MFSLSVAGEFINRHCRWPTVLHLTEVHKAYHGEELVFFPQWDKKQWREISRKKSKDGDGELSYDFVVMNVYKVLNKTKTSTAAQAPIARRIMI